MGQKQLRDGQDNQPSSDEVVRVIEAQALVAKMIAVATSKTFEAVNN